MSGDILLYRAWSMFGEKISAKSFPQIANYCPKLHIWILTMLIQFPKLVICTLKVLNCLLELIIYTLELNHTQTGADMLGGSQLWARTWLPLQADIYYYSSVLTPCWSVSSKRSTNPNQTKHSDRASFKKWNTIKTCTKCFMIVAGGLITCPISCQQQLKLEFCFSELHAGEHTLMSFGHSVSCFFYTRTN